MNTDRELLAAAAPVRPARTSADEPVPMLRFVAGTCLAVAALVRFCREVVRESAIDPIHLTPRILRADRRLRDRRGTGPFPRTP